MEQSAADEDTIKLIAVKPSPEDAGGVSRTPASAVTWLVQNWEIFPIILATAFLRFFAIGNVTFADDEAVIFQMARDAVTRGWLPVAGNQASLGSMHPPLDIYLFMLPAAISANPVGGEILVALFNSAAVLLTYLWARRYYGRLAGTIAAALYATSVGVWTYSRNIWSPNFVPFFVVVFLFLLFRGVQERRSGWFGPAVVTLGILYQLHESSLLLLAPLAIALLFAFRTLRWRDLFIGICGLLIVFAPYLFWEFHAQFADLTQLGKQSQHSVINFDVIRVYAFFLHPTLYYPYTDASVRSVENHILVANANSIVLTTPLRHLQRFLKGAFVLVLLLFVGSLLVLGWQTLFSQQRSRATQDGVATPPKKGLKRWWDELYATPYRQGLLLLLAWQLVPLIMLTRHSIGIFTHYLLFLLPGPFLLIALGVVKSIELVQRMRPAWGTWARYAMAGIAALVILAQLIGSSAALIDQTAGNFDGREVFPYFNDANSLQHALQDADQLAQQRHIGRIYVTISYTIDSGMKYLAEQVKTPIELNDIWHCFILPDLSAGPVVFLAQPNNPLIDTLLSTYTQATLIDQPQRLSEAPFKLYILTAKAAPEPVAHTFAQGLQLLSPDAQLLQSPTAKLQWLTTRWRITQTQKPASRTTYGYTFQLQGKQMDSINCTPTATWAGDQLFAYQDAVTRGSPTPAHISISAYKFIAQPYLVHAGPLTFTTGAKVNTPHQLFLTTDQHSSILLPVSQ
ncbi:hypothetical protein KSD_15980 [Ktedonobacter sp. SOSP1-85]|uniref:ArnT family glycosyltransferase n=1 Tax=Ktedonobacter sp. SOSP1-85 TaxID=2778367 RepID=UPI001915FC97|nr:glycosyltransferase family 39 protein [Ktedonobacter sp. SOSP1-85]GHO73827.1 hypothetical protein KSD_15980 [Ktedonobacter sp. SOSP1-85]